MTRYLISFDDGAMAFPPEDLPAVAEAAHWAGRFAKACRCAQEVRPMMDDPEA